MYEQLAVMLLCSLGAGAPADDGSAGRWRLADAPRLMLQPIPQQESVYRPPDVTDHMGGYNDGALSLSIFGRYMTDYIYRGLEVVEPQTHEDAVNVQLGSELRLDLGRLPDPFFRVLTNTAEGDDISNFQVIRPAVGLMWESETFKLALGTQTYTYPDRGDLDTAEVFLELEINDGAAFFNEERPILGPFFTVVYDFDQFEGLYVEGGLRRRFDITDTNIQVTVEGLVAYVNDFALYSASPLNDGNGFSHYQISLTAEYRLNTLLNISRRYGQWSLAGYLNYTDGIDNELGATTQLWGGGGIVFRY